MSRQQTKILLNYTHKYEDTSPFVRLANNIEWSGCCFSVTLLAPPHGRFGRQCLRPIVKIEAMAAAMSDVPKCSNFVALWAVVFSQQDTTHVRVRNFKFIHVRTSNAGEDRHDT